MFGSQRQASSGGSGSNLIEFRAGKMNMIGKMVHPDKRRGLVYITQSEDGLMHFCWKDRTSGKVEDDLIIFPDDFEFKRVTQCKTGRVYVLKCKTSTRRMFFWMQEPKDDKDDDHCRRVNELMNNPPSQSRSGGADGGDIQYVLNNMSQQQLMQLFGGVGQMGGLSSLLGSMNRNSDGSRTPASSRSAGALAAHLLQTPENNASSTPKTPSAPKGKSGSSSGSAGKESSAPDTPMADVTATASTASGAEGAGKHKFGLSDLQSCLSNLSQSVQAAEGNKVDLATAIADGQEVEELIQSADNARLLSVHLPELSDSDKDKKQQIKDTIASPQFQQALTMFSNALQSAQLGPVVSQFELPTEAVKAAYSGNLEEFVKALEKSLPAGASMSAAGKDNTVSSGNAAKDDEKEKQGTAQKKE